MSQEMSEEKKNRPVGRPRRKGQPFAGSALAIKLHAARRKAGLSVDQLSEAAKVSRTQIFAIEVGAVDPSRITLKTLVALQAVLGRTSDLIAAAAESCAKGKS